MGVRTTCAELCCENGRCGGIMVLHSMQASRRDKDGNREWAKPQLPAGAGICEERGKGNGGALGLI